MQKRGAFAHKFPFCAKKAPHVWTDGTNLFKFAGVKSRWSPPRAVGGAKPFPFTGPSPFSPCPNSFVRFPPCVPGSVPTVAVCGSPCVVPPTPTRCKPCSKVCGSVLSMPSWWANTMPPCSRRPLPRCVPKWSVCRLPTPQQPCSAPCNWCTTARPMCS